MKKLVTIGSLILAVTVAKAQMDTMALRNPAPQRTWYQMSGTEFIFSSGEVESNGEKLKNEVRFTGFFHINSQSHYDYNRSFGIYSGLSVINVGFINRLPLDNGGDMRLVQRSYSIGVPLAFKFGNMPKRSYLAVGAFVEYMFNYKQKAFFKGEKDVHSNWFPDEVRPFNSAVFAELHLAKGFVIRAKYYLGDFLQDQEYAIPVPGTTDVQIFRPDRSRLGYVSIGWVYQVRKKKPATKDDV